MADGMTVSELKGRISLDGADDAKKTLDDLGSKTNDTGSAFKRALGSTVGFLAGFTGFGLAAGAVDLVTGSIKGWIQGAEDAQVAQAATNQILSSGSHVMGITAQQVDDLATKTMNLTGVDDDLIHGAENILAGFQNISSKTFPDATQAATDMAISMQMAHGGQLNLTQSAQILGRALEDPARGARMLRQYNIILSDSQQKQIKDFMASGETAKAQAIIMDAVKEKVGGAADAYGATAEGKMMRFQTAMGNIGKTIGGIVLPILSALMDAVNPIIGAFANDLGPVVDKVTGVVKNFTTYIQPLTTVFSQVYDQVGTLAGIFAGAFGDSVKGVGDSFKGTLPDMRDVAHNIEEFVVHLGDAAKGPVGDFARALGGLVKGGFGLFATVLHSGILDDLKQLATTIGTNLAPVVQNLATWFRTSLVPAFQQAQPQFSQLANVLGTVLVPAVLQIYGHFVQLETWIVAHVLPIVEALLPPILSLAGFLAGALASGLKGTNDGMGKLSPVIQAVQGFFEKLVPPVQQFASDVEKRLQPVIKNFEAMLNLVVIPALKMLGDWLGPKMKVVLDVLQAIWGAVWPFIAASFQNVWDIIKTVLQVAWDVITGIIKVGLDLLSGNWSQAWTDIKDTFSNIFGSLTQLGKDIMKNLQDALKTAAGNVGTALHNAWTDFQTSAKNDFGGLVKGIQDTVSGIPGFFGTLGQNIVKALADSVRNGVGAVGSAFHDLFANASKNLPGGFHIPGFASGTDYAPGGMAMVGEGKYAELVIGPHMMNLDRGSSVVPVQLGSRGSGSSAVVQHFQQGAIVINGAGMSAEEIYDAWQQRAAWLARGQGHG